ncbi:hypothetical protein OA493_02960 [Gammaproteobacteria bacterium]|nr:hypothetical protein [Gammaproteobacteria bacterium]
MTEIKFKELGVVEYTETHDAMMQLIESQPSFHSIWSLEHFPVFTIGISEKEITEDRSKSPPPLKAITWNTSIMPVTVPIKPNRGHKAMHTCINCTFLLIAILPSEINRPLVIFLCQGVLKLIAKYLLLIDEAKSSWINRK